MKRLAATILIALAVYLNPQASNARGHGGGGHGGYCGGGGWHGGYCGGWGWHGGYCGGYYGGCWPSFSIGFGVGYPAYGYYSYPPPYAYPYPYGYAPAAYAYAPAGYTYVRTTYAYQPAPVVAPSATVAVNVQPTQPARAVAVAPVYTYTQRAYLPAQPQGYVATPNATNARPAPQPVARAYSAPVNATRVEYWPGKPVPGWHDDRQVVPVSQPQGTAPGYVVSR